MNSNSLNSNAAFRIALVLAICSGSVAATAQSNLKIPQSPEEYKELMREKDGKPCTTCGVVVSLRTRSIAVNSKNSPSVAPLNPGTDAGPGVDIATVPIGKGSVKPIKPEIIHVISVKYDNGSYGFVEQENEPTLKMGQRVRVTDGRVAPE